ncbi:MAG: hypothetical protein WCG83_01255 [Candidatus Peregrinibacteria bacterium]
MSTIIVLIGISTVLIAVILLKKLRASDQSHADAAIVGKKLKENLTHIRWYSEMILAQDFGKLNLSQIEYLHEANQSCEKAINNLQRILRNEGLEPTSVELNIMLKTSADLPK